MRVLLVSDHRYPAFGATGTGLHPREYPSGSSYYLHDLLALGLAEEGHEVFYLLSDGAEIPLPRGVNLVSGTLPEADICHSLVRPPCLAEKVAQLILRLRIPCLLTCHRVQPGFPAPPNWVFVSESHARAHGRGRVVLNGIHPGDYIFSETKRDYLLFMSAMDRAEGKGLDLALALSIRKGFRLVVAGTGPDYETISRVSAMCAAAGAQYVGDVRGEKKAELIAGARALLFPSRLTEGCPLVILEAMLSGTPVISSTCGGAMEIVTPETGFLCETEEEWGDAIDRLDSISPARCREPGLAKFHYRRMVRDYVREYEQEIASYEQRNGN
jgi:glycosyltransferase involved in cell wall biosynthesis